MGWVMFTSGEKEQKQEQPHYTVVSVAEQEPLLLEGNVETEKEQSYVLDPQKGEISTIHVTDGQTVAAGDVLFEYENETVSEEIADMRRQLSRLVEDRDALYGDIDKQHVRKNEAAAQAARAAKAAREAAQAEGSAVPPIASDFDGSAFDQAIEATQKAIRDMNNNIEDLQTKIDRMTDKSSSVVTASFDGVVTLNEDGKTNPQVPLVKITSQNSTIRTTVSEYDYESLTKGAPVSIYVKAQDRDIKGELSFIDSEPMGAGTVGTAGSSPATPFGPGSSSGVSRYSVTVKPELSLPNGFTVQVKVPQSGLVVVEQSVLKDGDQEYVFVEDHGMARRRNIKRVKRGVQSIVTEGLKVGDEVVMNPDENLKDGIAIITANGESGERP